MAYTKRKKRTYSKSRKAAPARIARRSSGRRTSKRNGSGARKQQRTQTVRLVIQQVGPQAAEPMNPNLVRVTPKRSAF